MISKRAMMALSQIGSKQATARAISSSAAASNQAPPALPADQMEVFVNGEAVVVPKNFTVLQACDAAGVDVPRFCYHQRLSIAGNCRMCLVEVEKAPKPIASCAFPAGPGMKIKTDTPIIKKAREGVMEFLLINHPLDCPICDQGGECDLQDQAMIFGSDRSRFTEYKRAVADKNLGPLIKTSMNRCIHCTRCVRFTSEVAGTAELGITGRGRDSEVGTYVEKLIASEMSGNVVDLCPVGALLSKPYAFTARSWELKGTESIDVSDALGANIRVDCRGTEVMRVLPRLNDAVNEEWISDKARFQYDGLKRQRLNTPLVKGAKGLEAATWATALESIRAAVAGAKGNELKAIAGKLADAEAIIALKDLFNKLGSGNLTHEDGSADLSADVRSAYVANTTVAGIEQADAILLIGTNPRLESPVFNARLRKVFLDGAKVALLGEKVDLTYAYEHLGSEAAALEKLVSGGSSWFETLKNAKKPVVVVGPGVLRRDDRDAVLKAVNDLVEKAGVVKEGWNGFNVIHDSASRVAALDLGFVPSVSARATSTPAKVVYLLGADDYKEEEIPEGAFVIYQGHHGDKGATRADVVLPGAAYTEKAGVFVNFEGRAQTTRVAVPLLADAREDWKIIRALSEVLGQKLPYDTPAQIRARLAEVAPHLAELGRVEKPLWLNGQYLQGVKDLVSKAKLSAASLASSISNFYMTDAVSRASRTMAKCTAVRQQQQQ